MGFAGDVHWREYWYVLLGLPSYMITPMTRYSSQIQARSLVKAITQLSDLHQRSELAGRSLIMRQQAPLAFVSRLETNRYR